MSSTDEELKLAQDELGFVGEPAASEPTPVEPAAAAEEEADDDGFGDFEEPAAAPPPAPEQAAAEEADDDWGDFGDAEDTQGAPEPHASSSVGLASPPPPPPPPPAEPEQDILELSGEEFTKAVRSAWKELGSEVRRGGRGMHAGTPP